MQKKLILFLVLVSTALFAVPGWWDNPDSFSSWRQYTTSGEVQNTGGSQAQDIIAKIDVPNLGIPRNTKDIWVQVEWEATIGTGALVTGNFEHVIRWTYDACPATPNDPLTNVDGVGFLTYVGTFTPTNQVSAGNTYDNGHEFSYQIDGQPECERLEIKFSVDPNSQINYRIEVQTVCWGVVEASGDCPSPTPALYPGAQDVTILEFTLDTGTGGDVYLHAINLASPWGADNSIIDTIELQTSGGTTIAGPTSWNPSSPFLANGSFFQGQLFTLSSDLVINENQTTIKVVADIGESASVGSTVNVQIPDSAQVNVVSPGIILKTSFPIACSDTLRTLASNFTAFTANASEQGVLLQWSCENLFNISGFNVYRKAAEAEEFSRINSQVITVAANPVITDFEFLDNNVMDQEMYWYYVEQISTTGSSIKSAPISMLVNLTTDVEQLTPTEFALYGNYPNPFNPSTTISYSLAETSPVFLQIYDITGRIVCNLVEVTQTAGTYHVLWNGTDHNGLDVANGIYLLRLQAGDKRFNQKMTLVR